jgi:hypothetical protein
MDIVWSEHSVKCGIRDGGDEYKDGVRCDAYFAEPFKEDR